ncbi:MAG: DUF11 domain-containing protein [Anaerolineae bacterium]|nr:DUF11 domain-containing protein [Anaerolineae bacterium]
MLKRYTSHPQNRRLLKPFVAIVLWLVLGFSLAYAIELPNSGSAAFLQTTGPNAGLNIGDFYTNVGGENSSHRLEIHVPCSWPGDQSITFALFDPESSNGTFNGPPFTVDEARGADDDTTFILTAADGAVVGPMVFAPTDGSDGLWVELATITPNDGGFGCGIYVLETTTSDDDDNGWRLSVNHDPDCDPVGSCSGISAANSTLLSNGNEDDNPDGFPGTGDELEIGLVKSSFQHVDSDTCQDFYFFVGSASPLTLNNFDMDNAGSITYFLPNGTEVAGDVSGATEWNGPNGTDTERDGDVFDIDETLVGWWRAEVCIPDDNQYIFEAQEDEPVYFVQPGTPVMEISKDDGKTIVLPGEAITHTIVFTNVSDATPTPGTATNVTLVDNLPDGVTFQSCDIAALNSSYPGSTCNETAPGIVTVTLGDNVLPGGGGFFNIVVTVDNDASDTLTNTVTLDFQDTLGNQFAPVEASDETVIPPDLTLEKTDGGVSTAPGGTVVYTLSYANVSNTGATGVTITDTIPANTTFNATASTPGWSCGATSCTFAIGNVDGNTGGTVDFAVDVDDPIPAGVTAINNSASIADDGSKGPDPTPANNVAADNTPLSLAPDMTLSKTDGGITTTPGGTVVYTLAYTNIGVIDANNVTITETVPANTTFNAAASAPTAWSCADGSGPGTTCIVNVGTVAANGGSGSAAFGLVVDSPLSPPPAAIANTAVIGDDSGSDPTPSNNIANDNTPLEVVDPQITKAVDPSQAAIGDAVNFSITVSNPSLNSNSPAQNVVLTDPLPMEYNLVSFNVASSPGGLVLTPTLITDVVSTAGHSSGVTQTVVSTITVDIPTLGVDESVTLSVAATVNRLANPRPTTIVNQATLDFDGGPRKVANARVLVPAPSSSPSTDDDDDDDDDSPVTASSPPSTSSNFSSPSTTVSPQTTPLEPPLPVLLLPETGLNDHEAVTYPFALVVGSFILVGLCLLGWHGLQKIKMRTVKK